MHGRFGAVGSLSGLGADQDSPRRRRYDGCIHKDIQKTIYLLTREGVRGSVRANAFVGWVERLEFKVVQRWCRTRFVDVRSLRRGRAQDGSTNGIGISCDEMIEKPTARTTGPTYSIATTDVVEYCRRVCTTISNDKGLALIRKPD